MARQAAHEVFAARGLHIDASGVQTELRVRWHGKQVIEGAPAGYAQSLDMNERVIFDRGELTAKGIDPQKDDTVIFPDFARAAGPLTVYLSTREPYDGPVNLVWYVSRDI
jgi:hypothetical protein